MTRKIIIGFEDNFVILFKEMYRINASIILNPMSFMIGTKNHNYKPRKVEASQGPHSTPQPLRNRYVKEKWERGRVV